MSKQDGGKKDHKTVPTAAGAASHAAAMVSAGAAAAANGANVVVNANVPTFVAAIEKLSASIDEKDFSEFKADANTNQFLWSNDNFATNDIVAKLKTLKKKAGVINVKIVIGEGHLFSIAPELQFADVVIIIDANLRQFTHQKLMVECLTRSNQGTFVGNYCVAVKKEGYVDAKAQPDLLFEKQAELVGEEDFFLASEARFAQCKQSLGKIAVAHYRADFLNPQHMRNLLAIVKEFKAHVSFINITSLMDWVGREKWDDVQKTLDLFQEFTPLVAFSESDGDLMDQGCTTFIAENPSVIAMRRIVDAEKLSLNGVYAFSMLDRMLSIPALVASIHAQNAQIDALYADPNFDPIKYLKQKQIEARNQAAMFRLQHCAPDDDSAGVEEESDAEVAADAFRISFM